MFGEQLTRGTDIGADHGKAGCHGLEQDDAKRIGSRREYEHVGRRVELAERTPGQAAHEDCTGRGEATALCLVRPVTGDRAPDAARCPAHDVAHAVQRHGEAFFSAQTADVDHQHRVVAHP